MRLGSLAFLFFLLTGCVYRIGGGLTAGMIDEVDGRGRTEGIEGVADRLVAKAVLSKLGFQLGEGLTSGATTLSPEQRASLEAAIDGALAVAAQRTAKGLRDEVSPQLREMVRQDIVHTLAEGLNGELGDSLEHTAQRVVDRTLLTLETHTRDPVFRMAMAEVFRDSVYRAVREGRPGQPAVGEVLETTLTENMLVPFERSVGGLAEAVADRVDESARRTERTLQAIISALVIILGVIMLAYGITRRQLARERQHATVAQQELRTVGAALDHLDEDARAVLLGKLDEFYQIAGRREEGGGSATDRSAEYRRHSPRGPEG